MGRSCCCTGCPVAGLFDFSDGTFGTFSNTFEPPNSGEDESWQISDGKLFLPADFPPHLGHFKWLVPLTHRSRYTLSVSTTAFVSADTVNLGAVIWNGTFTDPNFFVLIDGVTGEVTLGTEGNAPVVIGTIAAEDIFGDHTISLTIKELAGDRARVTAVVDEITYETTVDVVLSTDGDTWEMGIAVTYTTDGFFSATFDDVALQACGPVSSSSSSSSSSGNFIPTDCGWCVDGRADECVTIYFVTDTIGTVSMSSYTMLWVEESCHFEVSISGVLYTVDQDGVHKQEGAVVTNFTTMSGEPSCTGMSLETEHVESDGGLTHTWIIVESGC